MTLKEMVDLLKPIETEKQHKKALGLIETLMDAKRGTSESNILNVLTILVEKYEERHFNIPPPDPVEAIKFRMEQMGLTSTDLAEIVGGKNRASEILNRKRPLTVGMMKSLHNDLGVPAESLLNV